MIVPAAGNVPDRPRGLSCQTPPSAHKIGRQPAQSYRPKGTIRCNVRIHPQGAEQPAATAPKPTADATEIRRALDLLTDGLIEVRGLHVPAGRGKPIIVAGYFDDPDKAARAAAALDTRKPAGIYIVLNQIDPALFARSPNQLTDGLATTTSDNDIIRRRWLPLDFDPKRKSGISSTEDEHASAEDIARECSAWLSSLGWPTGILADSGNGSHLLYKIDLPNDAATQRSLRLLWPPLPPSSTAAE